MKLIYPTEETSVINVPEDIKNMSVEELEEEYQKVLEIEKKERAEQEKKNKK